MANSQWGIQPSLPGDKSILDYKGHNNMPEEQHNFNSYNNIFQQPMGNKESSIFGKPPAPSSGQGFNSFNNYNNSSSSNSNSAMDFSIGTFSTNDRPTPSGQQQQRQGNFPMNGQSQNNFSMNGQSSQSNNYGGSGPNQGNNYGSSGQSSQGNNYGNSGQSSQGNNYGSGQQSSQNNFGNNSQQQQGSYGNNSQQQGSYGNNSQQGNYGNNEQRSYGNGQQQGSYGNGSQQQGSYGSGSQQQQGSYGNNSGQQQQQGSSSSNFNSFNGGDVFSSSSIPIPGVTGGGSGGGGSGSGGNGQFQSSSSGQNDSNSANQGIRETGIIEKLLHSYGFIQCCERQARLFFHFSQFNGNIEHLKIGDPVEFEMTYDRRTGKPIASTVSKIAPEVVGVVMSEERVTGTVTTELRTEGASETMGRISYENRGECFFLPYNKDDVEGNVTLRSGDKVSFQIQSKQRGTLGASHIRLENPAHPVKYQGVVCSMKESFGFIERADVVKEIFFHFSEAKLPNNGDELRLGDDVEFNIQTRNGKEVACNIIRLDPGSVVFEDVCTEIVKGQVLKPLERGQNGRQTEQDALPGRIRYRAADHSEVEIPFGEKDQRGDFTLRHGDWVQFRVATDRRDQLRRATNISLLEESFLVSGERREQGIVATTKDGFGFIKCVDRDLSVFFRFNEVLDVDRDIEVDDEVEFTIVQDSLNTYSSANNRQSAIRIKRLTQGTVQFETVVEENITGVVSKEQQTPRSPSKHYNHTANGDKLPDPGLISYQQGETKKAISFYQKDVEGKVVLHTGDKVEFNIVQVKRNKEFFATNVKLVTKSEYQGFLAALKETFGFIETLNHDREIFFHYSNVDGEVDKLELGMEVEYHLGPRSTLGGCMAAVNVRLLPKGTIQVPPCTGPVIEGTVVRSLRAVNPEQAEYAGLVQATEDGGEYEFGITGMVNKRELLQAGDAIQFQVDGSGRAANIQAVRKKKRATVDAVKGQFGFLTYEVEEGKKLFFHMTEVGSGVTLQPGDTVEFFLVTNQRSGKSSACNVVKVNEVGARPERLINRLRTVSVDDGGPKLIVVRQPRGPDASKGFSPDARTPRLAGEPIQLPVTHQIPLLPTNPQIPILAE